ncbi:hypothetical protein KQI46_01080 [Lysinibacillus capsici]|uniref:hypothetical protein n=1 Tax=Lysinibacillus capsici TaxID=2115968 RepID=UPI001C1053F3|nr:hypothetical protein [Lysinibacillus capsici]MBU5250553.1 hypothetical protein [Lysinibacillus capsici]
MTYRQVIETTIKEVYPIYLVKNLLKKLEARNIISYKEDSLLDTPYVFSNGDGSKYHPKYDKDELLTALSHKEADVISLIQEFEYDSPYSYSVLFQVNGNWTDTLSAAIEEGHINSTTAENFTNDSLSAGILNCKPSHKKVGNIDILKFSLHLVGYLPQETDNRREIVYPIICLLNNDTNMLEIRFEKAKGYISNREDGFYIKKVQEIHNKIEELLGIELVVINLSPIVKYIKETLNDDEETEVAVSAQALEYHTGSKAILDTGNNDNMILPLIGNLKDILVNYDDLFNSNRETIEIRELLEDIILEAEYLSDHPWITLAWKNEVKSKVLKVKFLFNYQGQDFSVLQYYGNNADSERMSYVTQFIFDNKQKFESQTE